MSFDAMLQQAQSADQVEILPGWGQGRATFGGLGVALLYAHMQASLQRADSAAGSLPLRALNISFTAPLAPGAAQFHSEILRRGKSVTQMACRVLQDGQVMAAALASFGAPRNSMLAIGAAAAPAIGAAQDGRALPWLPGITPDFTRMVDFRMQQGDFPFRNSGQHLIQGWMRWSEAAGVAQQNMRMADLIALLDSWPPSVLQMLSTPAPASSLSWSMEFCAALDALPAHDWLQYQAQADCAADGYAHIGASCWDSQGRLLVLSRQCATVFA
ncbi:thioesterase family protein [Massilia sp. W12]|uniref:thioesterase family protein n=1 Tax=Massilia sp. W12 TaxID=3126507 RepID=UPI0030D28E8C